MQLLQKAYQTLPKLHYVIKRILTQFGQLLSEKPQHNCAAVLAEKLSLKEARVAFMVFPGFD